MLIVSVNFLSAVAAFVAAYFWWKSAAVQFPRITVIDGGDAFGIPDDYESPIDIWAKNVSNLNSRGAMAAAISATLMAISTLVSLDWSMIK